MVLVLSIVWVGGLFGKEMGGSRERLKGTRERIYGSKVTKSTVLVE